MSKRILSRIVLILIMASLLLCVEKIRPVISESTPKSSDSKRAHPIQNSQSGQPSSAAWTYFDALMPPDLPGSSFETLSISGQSSSPGYYETSEYLIGKVAVGIVFLESNGTIDPSTENWTPTRESQVVNEIQGGLSWLANYYPNSNVSFVYDIHYNVPTRYEPIIHPYLDQQFWISETMTYLGYPSTYYFTQVRDYTNALRTNLGTDWAYTIFVVDSYNDADGKFTDGYSAYAYLGGPFLVMTYDNDGYGIDNMDFVSAHESAHIFYATDEYDNIVEYSGYLNASDTQYTTSCLMGQPLGWPFPLPWNICTNTQRQLGWRDTDADGIQDIVDTFPNSTLTPYSPDPANKLILDFTGSVVEIPYPNKNPEGTGRNITINIVSKVEFRVDNGSWQTADANDTAFDEAEENFYFTTSPLSTGYHNIEVRGVNSVGNIETDYASDTVLRLAYAYGHMAPSVMPMNMPIHVTAVTDDPNVSSVEIIWICPTPVWWDIATDRIIVSEWYEFDCPEHSPYIDGNWIINLLFKNATDGVVYEDTFSILIIDNTPPVVTITSPIGGSYVRATIWINATVVEDNLNPFFYEIRINDTIVQMASEVGQVSWQWNTTTYADTVYIVDVTATDSAENVGSQSVGVTVDNTPPAVTIVSPVQGSYMNYSSVWINETLFDASSGINASTITMSLDGASVSYNYDAGTGLLSYYAIGLVEGNHSVFVSVRDLAGNLAWNSWWFICSNERLSAYLVVRGLDTGIYFRVFNSTETIWSSWTALPGSTLDSPAAAVCGNELHFVVRGMDGVTLYHGYVNLSTEEFSGWSWISGTSPSPPTLVSNGTVLTLVVRGADSSIYYRTYSVSSHLWSEWGALLSGQTCDKVSAVMIGNTLQIVVRGYSTTQASDNNTLWQGSVNLDSDVFSGWTWIPGSVTSSPTLALGNDGLVLVVRGEDNSIYINEYSGSAWQGWNALPAGSTVESPAATVIGETLYLVVVGMDETTLWNSSLNLETSGFSGWTWITGTTPSKPTLTS